MNETNKTIASSAALVDLQDSKIACNRGIQPEGVCEPKTEENIWNPQKENKGI
jgi:hypothetical protein